MTWDELELERRTWTIPGTRTKNARQHTVPLSTQALEVLGSVFRFPSCSFVFTADGRHAVRSWSTAKSKLSTVAGIDETTWRLHDLRRTAASGMQRLGVEVPIVERTLNHVSGTFRGIIGTYQTHEYMDEVTVALQRWGDHVERLAGGQPAKVVRLHTGA
jgi:integrase